MGNKQGRKPTKSVRLTRKRIGFKSVRARQRKREMLHSGERQEVSINNIKNVNDDTCSGVVTPKQNIPELAIEEATRVPFLEIQNMQNNIMSTKAATSERNTPELFVEEAQKNEEFKVDGRRIIDFEYFYEELQRISNHNSPLGCNFSCLQLLKERKKGFYSEFTFVCKLCNVKLQINNCKSKENKNDLDLNDTAVSSFMSIGSGFAGLEQVSSSLGIPCMSKDLYAKCHSKVCELWELAKQKCMEEAAKVEYDLAIQNGDVDANGVPMITVVADACWSKRSYRKNYTALSGAAVIIGYRTKKVLYMAVKNKYCMICARSANRNITCPDHICFKNYSGSSSGMEALAITEGFKSSVEMYGIIYSKLIADGDSSTYKSILDANPYCNIVVEKIECTNHLLRNYCTKLDELAKNTSHPLNLRKVLSQSILRLRRAVTGAIKYYNSQKEKTVNEKISDLKTDLLNGPNHVFGNHLACKSYYCKHLNSTDTDNEISPDKNFVPEMKSCTFYNALMKLVSRLVNNAKSLIYNVNSNIAEVFNSIIAKFVGGKRINYSSRQSYAARCATSVVAFNMKQPVTYLYNKVLHKKPNTFIARLELKNKMRRKIKPSKRNILKPSNNTSTDKDYGYFCQKPDLNEIDFDFAKTDHLKKLELTNKERIDLERKTILQSNSMEWIQERRKRLTTSSFGKVCKRGLIKCGPLVKNLLRGANLENIKSVQHGKDHENIALEQLTLFLKSRDFPCDIKKCGLFVDPEIPYLGASPDGLLDDDKIIEIKCPYSCANMSIEDGINKKKITFWKRNVTEDLIINTNHDWYYQVQGQLHITKKTECIFVAWTYVDMKVQTIKRNDNFWKNKMEEKLKTFYLNCMLPEIIDSRLDRKMEVKEPNYLLNAIKKRAEIRRANKRKNENVCEASIAKAKK